MSDWRHYHVHYSDVDRLILECVHPFMEHAGDRLERRFWERHYAGGPHLRVHLRGSPAELEALGAEFAARAGQFVADRPSADLATYSEARAAALLEREGMAADAAELRYRNNTVERHFARRTGPFASGAAAGLSDEFRHETEALAARIVGGARNRREEMLRLYLYYAVSIWRGDLPAGCVSFKSHWEGFAAGFQSEEVLARIRNNYRDNRGPVLGLLDDVVERHRLGTLDDDPVLADWHRVLDTFARRAHRILESGTQLTGQPATLEEARRARAATMAHVQRESPFVSRLWQDERFIAAIQYDVSFLLPRVLTNLLYVLVASVGLGPIEKLTLCHHAFRAAEDRYGCDLDDILASNIAGTLRRHSYRLEPDEPGARVPAPSDAPADNRPFARGAMMNDRRPAPASAGEGVA